jgi:hypothetical protein
MQALYWSILIALTVGAAIWRPPFVTRTVVALLGCGVASLILVKALVWPSDNYAFAMMFVDAVAAYIVLKPPPSLWQAIIGATYLTQIGLHAARIISDPGDMSSYYAGLSVMAFVQLAVVGGWWIDERLVRSPALHRPVAAAAPAHSESDGR